jgi:hypothetical protein
VLIDREVWSWPEDEEPRRLLARVQVDDDGRLTLCTPEGLLVYDASLDGWALSMLYFLPARSEQQLPPEGHRLVRTTYPDGRVETVVEQEPRHLGSHTRVIGPDGFDRPQ